MRHLQQKLVDIAVHTTAQMYNTSVVLQLNGRLARTATYVPLKYLKKSVESSKLTPGGSASYYCTSNVEQAFLKKIHWTENAVGKFSKPKI